MQLLRECLYSIPASHPDVFLMDEPASACDPISALKIEDLMQDLVKNYAIVIVTHNMQQAARVSDYAGFMLSDERIRGGLVDLGPSTEVFSNSREERIADYITGRFG
jgi:phosphate transport system ATP-binding protein